MSMMVEGSHGVIQSCRQRRAVRWRVLGSHARTSQVARPALEQSLPHGHGYWIGFGSRSQQAGLISLARKSATTGAKEYAIAMLGDLQWRRAKT